MVNIEIDNCNICCWAIRNDIDNTIFDRVHISLSFKRNTKQKTKRVYLSLDKTDAYMLAAQLKIEADRLDVYRSTK